MTATQKKSQRKAARRFYIVLAAIFIIGGIVGGVIGGAISGHSTDKGDTDEGTAPALSSAPYGTRDGKTLTDEGLLIVESSEFVPLECALSEELQEYTYYLCEAYYLDFDFVMALMYSESSFKADIVSSTDDYGLMQINACNHKELSDKLGVTDFTNPYQNIRAGIYILRGLFEKYDDATKVCMAYNMGEYGASVLWNKGIYETSYSKKVLSVADEYAAQRGGGADE